MKKSGMGSLLTTLFFIFLFIIAILIVWSVIASLINSSSKKIDQDSGFINNSSVENNSLNNINATIRNEHDIGNNVTNDFSSEFLYANYKLKEMAFNSDRLYLFKSSVQFRPMTQASVNLYANFTDHRVTRLPNIWYNLFTSISEQDFMNKLKNNNLVQSDYLRQHTDKIIIPIHGLPKWLTGYDQEGYPPKNYTQWNSVVRNFVNYFSQFNGAEIYYEISNEPDLQEFWKGSTDDWLAFYNSTATIIKQTDPNTRVGGAAANQYDGKVDDNRDSINIELIKYAKTENIPLDFISWHNYHLADKIDEAKKYYETELGNKNVEFIISEWNGPSTSVRCSNLNSVLAADSFLGFFVVGIDEQVFYTMQDDSPAADISGHRCYGLITQSDEIRPVFYVYSAFDNISRNSRGIYYNISGENRTIISKDKDGCYDILVWSLTENDNAKEYNISFDSEVKSVRRISVKNIFNSNDSVIFDKNKITFDSEDNEFNDLKVCF